MILFNWYFGQYVLARYVSLLMRPSKPLERPKILHLASLASHDIAARLRYVEGNLRPEWESRPYQFLVPGDLEDDMLRQTSPHPIDQDSLDRTLIGYCI